MKVEEEKGPIHEADMVDVATESACPTVQVDVVQEIKLDAVAHGHLRQVAGLEADEDRQLMLAAHTPADVPMEEFPDEAPHPLSALPAPDQITDGAQTPVPDSRNESMTPQHEVEVPGEATQKKKSQQVCTQLSEISFFYDNDNDEEQENDANPEDATFVLIQGAHCIGKQPNQCEDAYFISERAFGVSDGVSGWNDYGFSSDQFSLQLMFNAKKQIEKVVQRALDSKRVKRRKKPERGSPMKRNRSYLSMDNLDIEEASEQDEQSHSEDASSSEESNSSLSTHNFKGASGNRGPADGSMPQTAKGGKDVQLNIGNMTDRTHEINRPDTHSPLQPSETQQTSKSNQALTLDEQIQRKLEQVRIVQGDIDRWQSARNVAQAQQKAAEDREPGQSLRIDLKSHEVPVYPIHILEKAFAKVHAVGSATAMIAILNKNELQITNIGDSGFLIVRFKNGEPYCPYKSKEQQHAFNIPYQLSQIPTQADLEILRKQGKLTEMAKLKNVLKKKNNVCQDSPENADDYTVELKDGDIVMSATDGVFDNLFQHEVLSMITDYIQTQPSNRIVGDEQARELAEILAMAAIEKFKNPSGKKTPYQRKYKKTYNATWEVSSVHLTPCACRAARKTTSRCSSQWPERFDKSETAGARTEASLLASSEVYTNDLIN